MNFLFKQIVIWMSEYFPFLLRIFGLRIFTIDNTDITPDFCSGIPPIGRKLESKISWIIKNRCYLSIPIKIIRPLV
ncbi:hypothetical protein LCGC14_1749490 [marine sediment metagenome]|uniref:Uncharacterized protein n=1 Tax=marine sediment metagenome TaxID=412755 RepID=A0A0F9H4D2_9ZZZZ